MLPNASLFALHEAIDGSHVFIMLNVPRVSQKSSADTGRL
jgi:hypothetical protein